MKKQKTNKLQGITQAAYARRINVSRQMVSKYIELGMPTLPGNRIDPEAADRWRAENIRDESKDETFSDARRRKESALASLRELELRKAQAEVVERSIIHADLTDIFHQCRDSLLTIPARAAAPAARETDQNKIHKLIDAEIREVLNALADRLEGK